MFDRFVRTLAPVAGLAMGAMLAGCSVDMDIGGMDGVTMAELDTSAGAPDSISLVGPDNVIITRGETFAVDVTGDTDAVDAVRFKLDGDELAIGRAEGIGRDIGRAQITLVLPSLRAIAIAGSGDVRSDHMVGAGKVSIAGSGDARVTNLVTESLDISIAGSGNVEGSGRTSSLDVSVAGSGSTRLADVTVNSADISIMGSGDVAFASDGTVEASIMGSGNVDVTGRATCEVSAMGSGKLRCKVSRAGDGAETERTPAG